MEIRTDATVSFPRELVFTTYRDRLVELLPYLPNLRGLEIKSREERDGDIVIVNDFKGGSEIPAAVRSFLSESMLSWSDHATWKQAGWICDWQTKVHAFPGAILSSGYNRFVEVPGGTRIEFRGELTADASKVPGVPNSWRGRSTGRSRRSSSGRSSRTWSRWARGSGSCWRRRSGRPPSAASPHPGGAPASGAPASSSSPGENRIG